jgi:hypothetical protein
MDPNPKGEDRGAERAGRDAAPEPRLADELRRMAHEPLLPVEKRLIVFSLTLGIGLLGALWWLSDTFFSGR